MPLRRDTSLRLELLDWRAVFEGRGIVFGQVLGHFHEIFLESYIRSASDPVGYCGGFFPRHPSPQLRHGRLCPQRSNVCPSFQAAERVIGDFFERAAGEVVDQSCDAVRPFGPKIR